MADDAEDSIVSLEERVDRVLHRLPDSWRPTLERILRSWLGRVLLTTSASFIRLEMFDRSMTIAAQFFTSVVPILILVATWGADSAWLMNALHMPQESRAVLQEAVTGSGSSTFGVIGTLVVLASATSLSRALNRAFAAIWELPRPRSQLTSAWRWLAAVLALALCLVAARMIAAAVDALPPPGAWPVAAGFLLDLGIALFVPWVLLAGRISLRMMLPGALLFAITMMLIRPASSVWLPHALEVSADRYGAVGVAFTYLAWLYALSLCFLTANVLGQVLATDPGRLGAMIRGPRNRLVEPTKGATHGYP